ncbi:cupin domain-containing protein [Lichenibacterium ramalinae]|uniref:Cupin domain-containing protein n=2 Tax=Lichenibacterium ramalinae TaxID=2316527 RepID=A0A4Q2R5Y6_9HYPH|nr:cupin domain-containing protein [Lichenibacterium ramalinae]
MHAMQSRSDKDVLDASTAERLSTRLRLARHMRGMTLKVLADAAGCSESLLSKIENSKAYPSLPMLNRLVQVLGIGMGWMFEDRDGRDPVIARAGQRSAAALEAAGRRITVEVVIPDSGEHLLQCNILHVEAGASSPGEQQHAGEEAGYLLDGRLELTIAGRAHQLSAGDAFAFRSDQPHSFRNTGPTRASIFWVSTPPLT